MDDGGSRGFLKSLSPLSNGLTLIGAVSGVFIALWWAATWFANVSQLSATQDQLMKTVAALQNTEVTESVTIATLQQEVADNQAEIHQEIVDEENRHSQ